MTNEQAIKIIKQNCYVFNPLDFDNTTRINRALDVAVEALKQEQNTEWIPSSKPPKQDGVYLVTRRSFNRDKIEVLSYANNLRYIDDCNFWNIERAGWYAYDNEYGYIEYDGVTAWCELPKPYKESEAEE